MKGCSIIVACTPCLNPQFPTPLQSFNSLSSLMTHRFTVLVKHQMSDKVSHQLMDTVEHLSGRWPDMSLRSFVISKELKVEWI